MIQTRHTTGVSPETNCSKPVEGGPLLVLFSVCTGELQVNIKEMSVGGYRLASCDGAKWERARCTVY